jgi:hypothetical protein
MEIPGRGALVSGGRGLVAPALGWGHGMSWGFHLREGTQQYTHATRPSDFDLRDARS